MSERKVLLAGGPIANSLEPRAAGLLDTFDRTKFGNPRQTADTPRYGWLGAKQRRTELASGVIQMGVRSYVPAMGRFTSVDPEGSGIGASEPSRAGNNRLDQRT